MTAEIVSLRDGAPSLNDIPAMMRRTADAIERGDFGDVDSVFMLIPREDGYPDVFGWGEITGRNDPVIQCELAKMWLLTNLVARS